MNRVVINEVDTTLSNTTNNSTDIVYIPGFSLNGDLPVGSPVKITNVSEFNLYVGSEAPVFQTTQYYPVAEAEGTGTYGFWEDAIPDAGGSELGTVMFAAGTVDPSYVYAKELVTSGLSIYYERLNTTNNPPDEGDANYDETYGVSVRDFYRALLKKVYTTDVADGVPVSSLLDMNLQVKYLTTGGYPSLEYGSEGNNYQLLSSAMLLVAKERGDCIALIDHTDNNERKLVGSTSVFSRVNKLPFATNDNIDTFGAIYTPSMIFSTTQSYNSSSYSGEIIVNNILPGSFAYLSCLAKSLKTNPNWLSISGVSRGLVSNATGMHSNYKLTNSIAEAYQPDQTASDGNTVCLNAITQIGNYGYCIWGNRTLQKQSVSRVGYATRFVNLRNILSDVKKQARDAAIALMFEPNTDVLWANFKAKLTPLLDSMVSGSGISGYKIIKDSGNSSKTKLAATIKLYPIYSVEAFEINISLNDEEVTVS